MGPTWAHLGPFWVQDWWEHMGPYPIDMREISIGKKIDGKEKKTEDSSTLSFSETSSGVSMIVG